jgi:hypothetical protein
MNRKSFVVIDARITRIREDIAAGKVMFGMMFELDELLEQREAILRARGFSKRSSFQPLPQSNALVGA